RSPEGAGIGRAPRGDDLDAPATGRRRANGAAVAGAPVGRLRADAVPRARRAHGDRRWRAARPREGIAAGLVDIPCVGAADFGVSPESVRRWVRQANIDDGILNGQTSAEQSELVRLRREKRRLEQENEILRRAAADFAK